MRRPLRILLVTLAILVLLAGAAVGTVSWKSANELVHPERKLATTTPDDAGLAYERVAFAASDGVDLAGWWMPADDASRGTVLFLHGYGESKAQALEVAPFLVAHGYDVLAFDFRAHGESGGTHTTVGLEEVRDVEGAYAWLAEQGVDTSRVALFGYSMGAATALNAAGALPEVDAVVADSAFARLTNIVSNSITHFTDLPRYPFGPTSVVVAGWIVGADVGTNNPAAAAAALDAPILVIQGGADTIVLARDDGEALRDASPAGSEYWFLPHAHHVGARAHAADAYEARVLAFLDAHVK